MLIWRINRQVMFAHGSPMCPQSFMIAKELFLAKWSNARGRKLNVVSKFLFLDMDQHQAHDDAHIDNAGFWLTFVQAWLVVWNSIFFIVIVAVRLKKIFPHYQPVGNLKYDPTDNLIKFKNFIQ